MDVLPRLWYGQAYSLMESHFAELFFVGLPSAVICMWGSTFANAALFALIFPSVSI